MKLDILIFAAHPDDAELACGGSIIKHILLGKKVGIIDLTRGELGTRGSAEIRDKEAQKSAEILGLSIRKNLDLGDGFFEINDMTLKAIIRCIRKYKPETIWSNAPKDRHPDHGRGSALIDRAFFLSGLVKIETRWDNAVQQPHRAKTHFKYIQDNYLDPDIVIDVTDVWKKRMEAVFAFSSQFYNPDSEEPETPISSKEFVEYLEARAISFGRLIQTKYAEGFIKTKAMGVTDITEII